MSAWEVGASISLRSLSHIKNSTEEECVTTRTVRRCLLPYLLLKSSFICSLLTVRSLSFLLRSRDLNVITETVRSYFYLEVEI